MFVREMRCCSVVTVIVDCFMVCLCVVMDLVMEARRRIEEAEPIEQVEAGEVETALPDPPAVASDEAEESRSQVDEVPALPSDVCGDGMEAGVELMETGDQEATLPAQVTTNSADTGAEDTEASSSTGQSVNGKNVKNSEGYKCSQCQKQYKDKQYFRQHLRNHQFGKQHKCQCGKEFEHRGHLKKHIKYQHSSEKIVCHQCNKEFRSHASLKEHVTVFHEKKDRLYSKELKEEAMNLVGELGKAETARRLGISYSAVSHWETKAKKTFTCTHCGKQLSDSTRLKNHIKRKHENLNE